MRSAFEVGSKTRGILDRGEALRAERLVEDASALSAGEPYVLIARAHVWAVTRSREEASRAVKEACEAAAKNPFAMLSEEIADLIDATGSRPLATA